nr:IS110 family transposase [uncultured Cohaesibacter sp.]
MTEINMIGIDLAKRSFQLHGARKDGTVGFRKKFSRPHLLPFLEKQSPCIVAMEACATAHYWAREISRLGHEVRLIPPIYVKPFVKRQKNDAADAEAIVEAAFRPTMRFVTPKSIDQQTRAMLFRTRDLLVGQRTQLINALRGHLAEFGIIAATGVVHIKHLSDALSHPDADLPAGICSLAELYLKQIEQLGTHIGNLEKKMRQAANSEEITIRLQTMPGIGPITALAVDSFAPPLSEFKCGRDFGAWLGLVPKQHSTGGRQVLGKTSKMGQRDIRRLLIIGAMSRINQASRKRARIADPWLNQMLKRKPRMVVAIALANKMARAIWAMLTKKEDYRCPCAA